MVSIITPVYNADKYIVETIESVRAQTWQDWELLLIEDCGTDNSWQTMCEYCERQGDRRIRLFRQLSNMGAACARNRGIDEAEGRYIAYLDSDDKWRPDKLEKELDLMERIGAAFVFTGYEFADRDGRGTGKVVRVPEKLIYRDALKNTTIFTSTVMFDTEKIDKEQLKMPQIKSEDTALWWKLLRSGIVAYGLDENLTLYRRPAKSLSSNKLEAIRRIWGLYRKAEELSVWHSMYYFCFWALRAVKRRVGK